MRVLVLSVLVTSLFLSGCDKEKVDSLSAQVVQLQSQVDAARKQDETTKQELVAKSQQAQALATDLAAKTQEAQTLKTDLESAVRRANDKDTALTEKAKELELAKVGASGHQNRAEIAERESAALKNERDLLKSTSASLTRTIDELKKDVDLLTKERDGLKTALAAAQDQAGSASAQVATLKDKVVLVTKSMAGTVLIREELRMVPDGTYVRHGAYVRNHENGRLELQVNYENGRPVDQKISAFYETGARMLEGRIAGASPDGEWTVLKEDGGLQAKVGFRDGKVAEIGSIDLQGQIVTVALDRAGEEGAQAVSLFEMVWHALIPGLRDHD